MARPDVRLLEPVGERDRAAHDHPAVRRELGHDRVVDRPGGIVEEDMGAVRAGLRDRGLQVGRGAVVDAGVVAELAAPGELGLAAGDRDRARP